MARLRDSNFVLQKGTHPQNKHFRKKELCTALCGIGEIWITLSFPTLFLEMQRDISLHKVQKRARLLDKEDENLNINGCPQICDLVDPKTD